MVDFGVCVHMKEVCSGVGTGSVLLLKCTDVNGVELVQERSEEVRRCGKKWRVCPEVENVWQSSLPCALLEKDYMYESQCGLMVMM